MAIGHRPSVIGHHSSIIINPSFILLTSRVYVRTVKGKRIVRCTSECTYYNTVHTYIPVHCTHPVHLQTSEYSYSKTPWENISRSLRCMESGVWTNPRFIQFRIRCWSEQGHRWSLESVTVSAVNMKDVRPWVVWTAGQATANRSMMNGDMGERDVMMFDLALPLQFSPQNPISNSEFRCFDVSLYNDRPK